MIKGCKICGISDPNTLNFLINHPHPPKFIGFICNYPKSPRYIEYESLKKLLNISPKNCSFVAVLVKPDVEILEKIKNLPFDYYQLYNCSPEEIREIKQKYKKKIITAITIKTETDLMNYKLYSDVTDIYLFDSKGYEKSQSFDHDLVKNISLNKELMIAGNIQYNDELKNFKNLANFIDLSGGVETSGLKDLSKIEFFLNKVNEIKNEA
jgi:phosphoribosylanthranilate isomerase